MRIIIIGAFMLAGANIQAQEESDLHARFMLYTSCASVGLVVQDLNADASEIGLFKDDILTTVRSRLRGARIYSSAPKHMPYLYVNVAVVGRAFSVGIYLKKYVADLETDLIFPAETWNIGGTGSHGQDPGYILQGIGQYVDKFIDEYLAVNESACE